MVKRYEKLDELPPVFTTRQALHIKACPPRAMRRELSQICHGVWAKKDARETLGSDRNWHVALAGAVASSITGAVISHASAAMVYGIPLPANPRKVHLTRELRASASSRSGVQVWREELDAADTCQVEGVAVPVTTMRRTLLGLARILAVDDLVAVVDWMVRLPRPGLEGRWEPHDTLPELRQWVETQGRKKGVRRLRRAVALARVSVDSPRETHLRLALIRAGLPEPRCNPEIEVEGRTLGQPDLAYDAERVAVEYQGRQHEEELASLRDIKKGERFRAAGWEFIEVTRDDAESGWASAVERVADALQRGRETARGHSGVANVA
jgi:hypothetical protein